MSEEILLFLLNVALVLLGVLVNFRNNWPDFVHTDFGLPFVWATHTTMTIVGPENKWSVNLINLSLNIVCWISISFLARLSYVWTRARHTKKK